MGFQLRDYQRRAIDETYRYWMEGKGEHPIIVAGTGAGKSVIQAVFIKEAIESWPSTRILCVTHVKELIQQNCERLYGIAPEIKSGIYSAGLKSRDMKSPVVFAGIQSIYKKIDDFDPFDLVIIDECHLLPKKGLGMYRKLIETLALMNPNVKIVGLTATPFRLDSGSLVDGEDAIFDGISCNIEIRELVRMGYLTPLTAKEGISRIETAKLTTQNGEYKAQDQVDAFHVNGLTEAAVKEVVELSHGRSRWMIFCATTEHSDEVSSILNEVWGIKSESVHSKISDDERKAVIERFRAGELQCLVSVGVLTTGFDVAEVDLIALFRATQSAGLYLQILGRGMRLCEGKEDCLVLDFGENILRHGAVDEVVANQMARSQKEKGKGEPVMKRCDECGELNFASVRQCRCGYMFPISTLPKIQQEAARLAVMSDENKRLIADYDVEFVEYRLHEKLGKPKSIRVTYHIDLNERFFEWVCLNHQGFARSKAIQWVQSRMPSLMDHPEVTESVLTTENVLAIINANPELMREPRSIQVDETGDFPKILRFNF